MHWFRAIMSTSRYQSPSSQPEVTEHLMCVGLLSKVHISDRFIGSLPPTCWQEVKAQEFVTMLIQYFSLTGTRSGHGNQEYLMTTFCL